MPSNRTTTDVHGSPFLHVLLIQRLHRYKAMMKPSKRPRFRLTKNMLCTSAVLSHGKHACSWKSSAKIFWRPGSSNKSGFHTVYNGVRCGWSRVCMWSAAAALVSSHTLRYCRKQEHHALTFTLSVRTVKLDKVPALSLQWTSTTFCAQTGSVTGTGTVNTGTGQSHATGPAGTAETATVVTITAEIDHADMTGTIGMHQSLLPIDHSADICKFSCLCHSHTASWPRSPHEHRHRHRDDRWQMHSQRPADLSGKTVNGDPACCKSLLCMPLEFAGSYANKFSSGGIIHEDNGGLPMPASYQVKSHPSRSANSWHNSVYKVTLLPLHQLPLMHLLSGQLHYLAQTPAI